MIEETDGTEVRRSPETPLPGHKLSCSPAGWREVTVELQPTGLPEKPWSLHVFCDAGNNWDYTVDELKFIGAAIVNLAWQTERGSAAQNPANASSPLRK